MYIYKGVVKYFERDFIKKTHYLDYQFDEPTDIKLGFTTRENGLSPYPNHSFNMARYISDSAHHITHHQDILANLIGYPRDEWVFLYKHMIVVSLKLQVNIKEQILMN